LDENSGGCLSDLRIPELQSGDDLVTAEAREQPRADFIKSFIS